MIAANKKQLLKNELNRTGGVLRLAPAWVPRSFMIPGQRLKLHPADLYAFGKERGGINERWFSSTTKADNGPDSLEDEGLSYIVIGDDEERILLKDAIDQLGEQILGSEIMKKHGGWQLLCKFFDNMGPIPFHIHQMDEHAKNVGKTGKPESYYFPPQYNHTDNNFPYTFFGLDPITTKEDIKQCLADWENGDNGMLKFSKAYRLTPGTGWDIPAGILHAPGSLVTYEPQRACDIFGMFQSIVEGRSVERSLLVKDVPEDKHNDLDYLVDMVDWDANVDPDFMKNHYRLPKPVKDLNQMQEEGYEENWIVYDNEHYAAKELTVLPGRTIRISDSEAYGFILVQGRGTIEGNEMESPNMIRFGELTSDEFFVTKARANEGALIVNTSRTENLVMLKHFGPPA
jgi:hypothetical protein